MRQTSEEFMNKMLEENTPTPTAVGDDLANKIAKTIDEKLEQAMQKFTEQMNKVNVPTVAAHEESEDIKDAEDIQEDLKESE